MADIAHRAEAAHQTERIAPPIGRQPLVVVLIAVAAGIVLDRATGLSAAWSWGAAALGWLAWLMLYRGRRDRTAAWAILLAVAGLSAAWHHTRWCWFANDEIGRFAREQPAPVCLRGRAVATPASLPKPSYDPMGGVADGPQSRLLLQVEAIRDRDHWLPASGQIRVAVAGPLLGVHPGDRVQVFGKLSAEPPLANPGVHDFAADARRDRRLCSVRAGYSEGVSMIAPASRGLGLLLRPSDALAELRGRGDRLLRQYVGRARAGLAMAMLLGDRSQVTRDESESFTETGTVHLLVIAGLHVEILAAGLFFALRLGWLSRRWGPALVAALTVFYALLTDSHPPVLRATVLVVVFCLSLSSGRRTLGFNTLALAALVVLVINPADLFSVGVHLSFLAVAALVWLAPRLWWHHEAEPLDRLLAAARPWWLRALSSPGAMLTDIAFAGMAIGAVSLPLVMHEFHIFSVACALLTPLLFLPLAAALLSGLGVLLFGWLLPPLAAICGGVCDASLWLIATTVDAVRHLPGSYAWVAGPPTWWLTGFYASLAVAVAWPRLCPRRRWCAALMGGWIALGVVWPAWQRSDGNLRCTVLSVGHGNAVVLELPDGRTMIADAGHLGLPGSAADAVSGYLWSRGRTHIDAIVISHADSDHYNAVPRLVERFSVGVVYVSRVMLNRSGRGVAALFAAIRQAGVPIRTVHGGDRLDSGEVRIDVLHPPDKGILAPSGVFDNANCVVLAVDYRGLRLLLPGDLESPGLDDVIAEPPWRCDVLVAPHHGSSHNAPLRFAAWCTPACTVISGGFREDIRAARAAYEGPGKRLLHTAAVGAVTAVFHDGSVGIEAFRNSPAGRAAEFGPEPYDEDP